MTAPNPTPIEVPPIVIKPIGPPSPQPSTAELILAELQKQTPLLQVIANYLNNGAQA